MRIDVEELKKYVDFRKSINAVDLDKIDLYENDKLIDKNEYLIQDWKFIGLSTFSMLEHCYLYKEEI